MSNNVIRIMTLTHLGAWITKKRQKSSSMASQAHKNSTHGQQATYHIDTTVHMKIYT